MPPSVHAQGSPTPEHAVPKQGGGVVDELGVALDCGAELWVELDPSLDDAVELSGGVVEELEGGGVDEAVEAEAEEPADELCGGSTRQQRA